MTRSLRILSVFAAAAIAGGCATSVMQTEQAYARSAGQETSAQTRARIHTELGAGYYSRGQFDVALEELTGALKDDPSYAPAYGMIGLVYSELRDDAQAERNFMRAIELNPQDPELRNNYGWFLCQRGREPQSLVQFELAIRNPFYRTPDMALLNAGRCANRLGDRKGAEGYIQQVLKVSPANPMANYMLADMAYKAGDMDVARTRMRTVMAAPNPGPDALLLGFCIEHKLGNQPAEASYQFQLRQRYPNSREAKLVESSSCQ